MTPPRPWILKSLEGGENATKLNTHTFSVVDRETPLSSEWSTGCFTFFFFFASHINTVSCHVEGGLAVDRLTDVGRKRRHCLPSWFCPE